MIFMSSCELRQCEQDKTHTGEILCFVTLVTANSCFYQSNNYSGE